MGTSYARCEVNIKVKHQNAAYGFRRIASVAVSTSDPAAIRLPKLRYERICRSPIPMLDFSRHS